MPKLTPYGALLKGALIAHVGPRLAQDAKLPDFGSLIAGAPMTNRVSQRTGIAQAVQTATKSLLAADADLDDVAELLEAVERIQGETEGEDMGAEANSAIPMVRPEEEEGVDEHPAAAKIKEICERHNLPPEVCSELAEAVGEEDEGLDLWDRRAADARKRLGHDESEAEEEEREERESAADARKRHGRDETPEEMEERRAGDRHVRDMRRARDARRRAEDAIKRATGAADKRRAEDARREADDRMRRARDARRRHAADARRRADDRRKAEDEKRGKDMISREEAEDMVKKAVDRRHAEDSALYDAREFVKPWVGDIRIACDSAEQVYRETLKMLNDPEAGTIHASALRSVISRVPKPSEANQLALDSRLPAGVKPASERFANAGRVSVMG